MYPGLRRDDNFKIDAKDLVFKIGPDVFHFLHEG